MKDKELEYKGYKTKINFDESTDIYYGSIEGIADVIYFESPDPDKIEEKFHEAVDNYEAYLADNSGKDALDTDAD